MSRRNRQPEAEPEIQVEAIEPEAAEPEIVPAPGRPPCARFRMNETITPAERRAATRQYVAGGEYDADEFLTALWEADDPAVSPVEAE